jgi:predicted enzyme related to lactoylglutathione lyase
MHGQFVWYDLMTSDVAGAMRFYPAMFGWKTQKFAQADPSNPYTMWTVNGEPFGGVAKLDAEQAGAGASPYWMASVMVNNVDQTAQQASSLGGKIIAPPFDIPETGRYAIIEDPTGAVLAVFATQFPATTFDGTPSVGRPSWHELMTTDYKRAFEFYSRLFGWEKTSEMDMGPELGTYFMFGMKGKPFGGMYNKAAPMADAPPNWLPYVHVKDVAAAAKAAEKAGGKVMQPPMDVPGGGSIAMLIDPQGAQIAVHSLAALADAKAGKNENGGKKKAGKKATGKKKAGKVAKAGKAKVAKSKPKKSKPKKSKKDKKKGKKKDRKKDKKKNKKKGKKK